MRLHLHTLATQQSGVVSAAYSLLMFAHTLPPSLPPSSTLVYELLTLETPLSSLSVEELIWAVGQGHTQSLSRLPKSRFCRLISQCWRNNPELRPSFNELLAAIEQDVSYHGWWVEELYSPVHVYTYSGTSLSYTVEALNNVTFGTSYSVHYREVSVLRRL